MSVARFVLALGVVLPLAFTTRPAASSAPLDDATIFALFDQANTFDIETARLGVIRGHSEEVRTLAADVLRDHSMVLQMTRDLAARAGIRYTVPTGDDASRSHGQALMALSRLNGTAFDVAYLRHEVGFHDGAVHAVREVLLPAAANPDLRQLLSTVLPGFEHHLGMTRDLAAKMKAN